MNYHIPIGNRVGKLTTDHSRSNYGIPVLVVNGEAHGAADLIRSGRSSIRASDVVFTWGAAPERNDDERRAAAAFLGQWPDGPQIPVE